VPTYAGRWVIISGVRDIAPASVPRLRAKMEEIVAARPAGIIFGGARGTDTAALRYARAARGVGKLPALFVIVPGTVAEQPRACAVAIRECADAWLELGLPLDKSASYHERNAQMLTGAQANTLDGQPGPVLVAFVVEGSPGGGTRATVSAARARGIAVEEIDVDLDNQHKV